MFKKIGVLALLAGSVGMALTPAAAYAEGRYDGRGDYHYSDHRDGDRNRRDDHEWRENYEWRKRAESRRGEDFREQQQWRQHEFREHEERENRGDRYGYQRGASHYFGYGR